jgi:hypothetical protein
MPPCKRPGTSRANTKSKPTTGNARPIANHISLSFMAMLCLPNKYDPDRKSSLTPRQPATVPNRHFGSNVQTTVPRFAAAGERPPAANAPAPDEGAGLSTRPTSTSRETRTVTQIRKPKIARDPPKIRLTAPNLVHRYHGVRGPPPQGRGRSSEIARSAG